VPSRDAALGEEATVGALEVKHRRFTQLLDFTTQAEGRLSLSTTPARHFYYSPDCTLLGFVSAAYLST
jgi:hypothetical protein